MRGDHVNRARNADQAARTCERFVYSIVTVTRFLDYEAWHICLRNSQGAQRYMGFFSSLCFSDADWLDRQTLITWSWEQTNTNETIVKHNWFTISHLITTFREGTLASTIIQSRESQRGGKSDYPEFTEFSVCLSSKAVLWSLTPPTPLLTFLPSLALPAWLSLKPGVDNFNKLWLEGSSAYKETIDIWFCGQLPAVFAIHWTWQKLKQKYKTLTP